MVVSLVPTQGWIDSEASASYGKKRQDGGHNSANKIPLQHIKISRISVTSSSQLPSLMLVKGPKTFTGLNQKWKMKL